MSNKLSNAPSKKIKIKKNTTGITTKIVKIKPKKTPDEINTISQMLSNCNLDDSFKKRKDSIDSAKLSKLLNNCTLKQFIPLDLTPLEDLVSLSKLHFGIIPIYLDLDKAEKNWIKNITDGNISILYILVTRFLVSKINPISINIYPHSDNTFSLEDQIEDKYGITSEEILLIDKIEVASNLDIYLVFMRNCNKYIPGYKWRKYIELYNHIEESYNKTLCISDMLSKKSDEYHYEENPYRAIIANQMAKKGHIRQTQLKVLGDGFEAAPFKLAHLYQNIMDNYRELVDSKK